MATKTINTRIGLKYDTLANWTAVANTFVPIKGEVIFYEIPTTNPNVDVNVPNLSKPQTPPAILFKVGDGTTVLGQLPWGSAIAADVYAWAKQQSLLGGTNNNGTWTWSNEQAYAQEQAEVAAFVKRETANLKMKVDQVTESNYQEIYGEPYTGTAEQLAKLGKYQIRTSTDNGNTWTVSGEPFAITIEDYTAGNGLSKSQNNEFSVNLGQDNAYLGFGENGELQATTVTAVYTPAVPATEGVHWTQEEIAAAQPGDPAYGKTTDDWKVEPVAGSPATITAGDGLLTGASVSAIKSYVDAKAAEQLTAGEVTVISNATADQGYAKTYTISQGGQEVGRINIPKDFLVKSAELKVAETAGEPYAEAQAGDKYIDFTINTVDASETAQHIYLPVKDLVDVYTGGETDYATVNVDNSNVITATVKTASVQSAHGKIYNFTSWSAQTGGEQYGTGKAEEVSKDASSTTVKVIENTVDGWTGRTFTVNSTEVASRTRYQLNENGQPIQVWVEITSTESSTDGIAVASDVKSYVDSQIAVATPNIEAGNGIGIATAGSTKTVSVKLDETGQDGNGNEGSGLAVSADGLKIDDTLTWYLQCGTSTVNIN